MKSNSVHRAAFVRKMNENRGGTRRTKRVSKRRAAPMRRNKRSSTAAERKAYGAGHDAIFGKRRKPAKRRAAPKRAKATSARRHTSKSVKAAERALKKAQRKVVLAQGKAAKTAARAEVAAKRAAERAVKAKARAAAAKTRAVAARAKRSTPEAKARRRRAATKKKWPKQTRTSGRGAKKKRVRVAYGPYRRATLSHPRRGGRVLSYMTRRGGKLRKIPAWAIAGAISPKDYKTEAAYQKAKDRIAKRRKSAAARVERGMDAFTPNSGAGHMNENKKKRRKKKKAASRKAGGKRRRTAKKRRTVKRRRPSKKRRSTKARRTTKKRRSVKRRRSTKARRTTKRRRSTKARRTVKRRRSTKRRRSPVARRVGRRKVRRLKRGLYFVSNRGKYLKNGFAGDLKTLLKTGALVLVGFFAHKALTGALVKALTSVDGKFAGMAMANEKGPTIIAQWQKPLTGAVVGAAGIAGLSMVPVKAETRMAVGAGIMVSFLESLVRTALGVANQTQVLSYLDGYSNSPAYGMRGAGRRGMRGLGVARNAHSIGPRWTPVGSFQQASAGMGEYFSGQSGMGEYFAGPGTQGVGFYEKAGPLALQPGRSHMGNLPVDDGIRPDANLDAILDLAESAAGLGGGFQQAAAGIGQFQQAAAGMGEFFTANPSNGGFAEATVPTQSQWIPNGPLWAGSMSADATKEESQLPAGILQGPGGNGVLSGG